MKTLETIQKTCNVFHILAKVAMILSFIWAGFNALGALGCLICYGMKELPIDFVEDILQEYNVDILKATGILLADFVFAITKGILFYFASRYLKQELEDGTPFTIKGANLVKDLGIKTIVMPLVAIIISSVIYACFNLSFNESFGNSFSITLGIALILVSLILRHGAELRENDGK